ncbi:hypothetical protein [Ruminococcus sp.]|uniref:hypothetical protein n=1 Tax=Ruminococcus sp. TaxID=41978 RepID=UPI0025D624A1|nr:hypothetical protein [Ruminococcus sp.]MCI5817006.1 hypothetical protein [Ruminococcus sp.]
MGLFDIFQRGGKYFGKDIPPHCEYCDFGKRAKDGNKVLCDKRGLVDATFSCPKFVYSPLKRIPVKQLNRVGFLDEDDEFHDDDVAEEEEKQPAGKPAPPPLQAADAKPEPVQPTTQASPAAAPEATAAPEPASEPKTASAEANSQQEAEQQADSAADAAALEAEKAMQAAFQSMNQPKSS